MKEQIKELRLEIDGLAQLCEGLKPIIVHSIKYDSLGKKMYDKEKKGLASPEIKEAIKSLKLSKAWLGKVLESLGSENPYGSGYKTVEDIVPETDRAETIYGAMGVEGETPRLEAIDTFTLNGRIMNEYSRMSHIERVDWLRTEVRSLIEKISASMSIDLSKISGSVNVEKYIEELNSMGIQFLDSKDNMKLELLPMNRVKEHLTEARFWLGFEMGRIRDESK